MFYVDRKSIVFAIPNNGGNSGRLRYTKIKIVTNMIQKMIFEISKGSPLCQKVTWKVKKKLL